MSEKAILLYTPDAQIDNATKSELLAAGYIAIQVADVEAIKVLSATLSAQMMEVATDAMLRALHADGPSKLRFGQYVISDLIALRKKAARLAPTTGGDNG